MHINDFKIDKTVTLQDHAKTSGEWWVNNGAVYDLQSSTWVTIDDEKTKWIIKAVLNQFAEEFTNIAEYNEPYTDHTSSSEKSFSDRLKELEEFEVARDLRLRQEEVSCQEVVKNLGNRKVGKIGIVIGKDPDKKILSHPVLCNYVGGSIPLYQDETGHFVLHFEEKVYLHDDKNVGHTVRDRSNIKDRL